MYAPGVLWTAARHKIPLLSVMHNNRGYHQEVMHVQRIANRRNRVASARHRSRPIGTSIKNPDIDYASLAKSMGYWARARSRTRPSSDRRIKRASRSSNPASRRWSTCGRSRGEGQVYTSSPVVMRLVAFAASLVVGQWSAIRRLGRFGKRASRNF